MAQSSEDVSSELEGKSVYTCVTPVASMCVTCACVRVCVRGERESERQTERA
jgi:hypothetical protein